LERRFFLGQKDFRRDLFKLAGKPGNGHPKKGPRRPLIRANWEKGGTSKKPQTK